MKIKFCGCDLVDCNDCIFSCTPPDFPTKNRELSRRRHLDMLRHKKQAEVALAIVTAKEKKANSFDLNEEYRIAKKLSNVRKKVKFL